MNAIAGFRYGARWATSDAMLEAYERLAPLEAGLFDYNRLENR